MFGTRPRTGWRSARQGRFPWRQLFGKPEQLPVAWPTGSTRKPSCTTNADTEVTVGVAAYRRFMDQVREISEINAVLAERELTLPGIVRRKNRSGSAGQKAVPGIE